MLFVVGIVFDSRDGYRTEKTTAGPAIVRRALPLSLNSRDNWCLLTLACFRTPPNAMPTNEEPWRQPDWIAHSQIMLDSYAHWIGQQLIPRVGTPEEQSRTLFEVPFVVVSHGTQDDPILNYATRTALQLWEMELSQFLQTPSRLTAEPMHRDERALLMARTTRDGYVDDYRGIRISSTGKRFEIEQAIVWNLLDGNQQLVGQAATFDDWKELPSD